MSFRRALSSTAVALTLVLALVSGGSTAAASKARSSAWCAGAVSWKAARGQMGERVRVKARIVRGFYARSSRGRPTFLNLGYDYPDTRRLTVLIWGRNRVNFPRGPERMFPAGTLICAQGIVSSYRGVAEIEVALWDARSRLLSF